ncbi:MAG: hypothetical protein AAF629_16250 [Chloroflexota bacterium]
MKLIWPIIKDTGIYFWEELFYLVIYNLITFFAIAPSVIFWFSSASSDPPLSPLVAVPTSLLLASISPYLLFALFWTVYDISEGKAIKFLSFFTIGWGQLKQAYIWWGINFLVLSIIAANITFYGSLDASWRVYPSMLFFGILIAWILTQTLALTLYPRLMEPGFRLASRNALVIIAKHPIPILFTVFLCVVVVVLGVIVRPVGWFASIAFVATMLNMTTRKILKDLLQDEDEEEEEETFEPFGDMGLDDA